MARASVASERTAPGDQSARARGAAKFDVLATRSRDGSSTFPGRVVFAKARLSWIGPPGWNSPTWLSAPAPGMPVAITRPVSCTGRIAAAPVAAVSGSRSGAAWASAGGARAGPLHERSCEPSIAQRRRPSANVTSPVPRRSVATPRVVRWTVSPVDRSTRAHPRGVPIRVGSCRDSSTNAPENAVAVPGLQTVVQAPCRRGSGAPATCVRAGPRSNARIAARLPQARSAAVPKPRTNGRGPAERRCPSRVCMPRPASATTKHARVSTSTSAIVSGSTSRAERTTASARKPSRKKGKAWSALRRVACDLTPGPSARRLQAHASSRTSGTMRTLRSSLTTVATSRPTAEYPAPAAIVCAVSGTAAPAHRPAASTSRSMRCPTRGKTNTAAVPKTVIVATAELTSRSLALTTGAAAMMAELPQTAVPTPISTDTRRSTPRRRPTTTAKARAAPMVHRTSPIASAPIRATVSRFSRSPSRMIPSLRTVRVENWMPGTLQAGAPARLITSSPSSMASGTSKPIASA